MCIMRLAVFGMPQLSVVELWMGSEIAAASTFWYRAFHVAGEPLPCVVEVQNMLALETEGWEAPRHLRLLFLLRSIRARNANHFETDDATWKMSPTSRTAHASVYACCEEGVPSFLSWGGVLTSRASRLISQREAGVAGDAA